MRRFLAIVAILTLMVSTNAKADATLTITLTGAGAANTTRALVVSDADGARVIAWAKTAFGSTLTNKQAMEAVFDDILAALRTNVKSSESGSAAKSAGDAVLPVAPK